VGVPVLVKISYFPNWEVSGADGPYRLGPNMMVVVPTSTDVHLNFGRSNVDLFAYLLTLLGIVLLVVWRIIGDVRHRTASPLEWGDEREAEREVDNDMPFDPIDDPSVTSEHAEPTASV
jgi:hypothetical protein